MDMYGIPYSILGELEKTFFSDLKKAPHDMNKILSQMEHAHVYAKDNFIDKKLMRGQKFRNFAHKMIHYLHLVEGELEDISEFVANALQEYTKWKNAEKQRLEKRHIPDFVLNDIEAKFFSSQAFQNPMENITEVMKQIEQAHWHTREYYVDQKRMKGITFRNFVELVFKHLKIIADCETESVSQADNETLQNAIDTYAAFKCSIPTYGAILLNNDGTKTILVKGKGDTSWTFPKGKQEGCESPITCAIREVHEEIGVDISDKVDEKRFIEYVYYNEHKSDKIAKRTTLYIVRGIPESTKFTPNSTYEIGKIEWALVDFLPNTMRDGDVNCFESHAPVSAKRFNLVVPYINELRRQIKRIMDTKYNEDEEDSCPVDHSNRIEESDGIFSGATKRAKFERNFSDNGFE